MKEILKYIIGFISIELVIALISLISTIDMGFTNQEYSFLHYFVWDNLFFWLLVIVLRWLGNKK